MQSSSDAIFEVSQAESAAEAASSPAPESSAPQTSQEPLQSKESTPDNSGDNEESAGEVLEAAKADIEEPVEEGEEEVSEEAEPQSQEEIEAEIAYLEALDGNKYPETLTFKKKIDGEIREVSLKDALAEYSGKYAVKERFAEANTMKQKAEHQARQIAKQEYELKRTSQRFTDAMTKGDTRSAIDALCSITGQDPEAVWAEVVKVQREAAQKLANMSPEDWQRTTAEQEANYWKNKHQMDESARVEAELLERKLEAQEKFGLEDADLHTAHEMLLDLKKQGAYTKEVTLNDVVETARDFKIYKSIDATIREVLPDKVGDDALYMEILKDTKQYNMSKEDWINLFNEIKSSRPQGDSKLKAKVTKNSSPTAPKKKAPASGSQSSEYLDIVNLDDL